jgi:hypothetical protein
MLNVAENHRTVINGSLFTAANPRETRRAAAWLEDRIKRGRNETFSEVVELTPELAELLLQRNEANRPVRRGALSRYKADVVVGAWELNGEALKVSEDGLLNDGQHRCMAVIETGASIHTYITFGLERATRMTLDQGDSRTSGDYLQMEYGDPNANVVASACALLAAYLDRGSIVTGGNNPVTKQMGREIRAEHPGVVESARVVNKIPARRGISQSQAAFLHYLVSRTDREAADLFIEKLATGAELKVTDPIYRARERLLSPRMTKYERMELLFRTWNAWRRRGTVRGGIQLNGELPQLEA